MGGSNGGLMRSSPRNTLLPPDELTPSCSFGHSPLPTTDMPIGCRQEADFGTDRPTLVLGARHSRFDEPVHYPLERFFVGSTRFKGVSVCLELLV